MLQLNRLHIVKFKNIIESDLSFQSKYVAFCGNNGAGKTSILDAIYYLSIGKSYFNSVDQMNINHASDYFNLHGYFGKQGDEMDVFCSFMKGARKKIKKNGLDYQKLSDHLGEIPVVMIAPNDNMLIVGGSEERRRFMDVLLSQLDRDYMNALINYNQVLLQRNAQLVKMGEQRSKDRSLLSVYDKQLTIYGQIVHEKRVAFIDPFKEVFVKFYKMISNAAEEVKVVYDSQMNNQELLVLFDEYFEKDLAIQRTMAGIHKDDLYIELDGKSARKFASLGQQKTILLSLKLAQFGFMTQMKGFEPLLLLDDVFDRLDRNRVTNLIDVIIKNGFGQIFITDTNAGRVKEIFAGLENPVEIFMVEKGFVKN